MSVTSWAQQNEIQTLTLPQSIEIPVPEYPFSQARQGGEALISMRFMVDTDGQVFDPVIVETTGHKVFRDLATEALLNSRFEPATIDGEPIVGSSRILFRFDFDSESQGASPTFTSAYRYFQRSIEEGERERIETFMSRLEDLGARNHYEHAFLSLARYTYAKMFGTEMDQLRHIRQALSLSTSVDDPVHLDDGVIVDLRRALFPLQVQHNYLAEAIETYDLIVESDDAEGTRLFAEIVAAVREIGLDDTEYYVPLDIDEFGSTGLKLFKQNFALIGGEGRLAEAVLRCERNYLALQIERDVTYNVPSESGDCSIEIVGDAGANFFLLQH